MISFRIKNTDIKSNIFIPKYYDPNLDSQLHRLSQDNDLIRLGEYIKQGVIEVSTGDEIGKMAYGTGDIPFVRTSDISNWEIKTIPKQGVSNAIYESYNLSQDVKNRDILLVRDGTYLIGTNCFVTELDLPMLYQSHILKLRVLDQDKLNPYLLFLVLNTPLVQKQIRSFQFTADIIDTIGNRFYDLILPIPKEQKTKRKLSPYLLLALLNSYIVKRQFRTKQFTRDVIDTLGKRIEEVVLPIPKELSVRNAISERIEDIVVKRINARVAFKQLSNNLYM